MAIQQGKAHDLLNNQLHHLLDVMHHDPDLNLAAATCALFATAVDVIVRLDEFLKYPYKYVSMCRKWFPKTHKHAIIIFLQAPTDVLDVGFSWKLQCLALAQEGELRQRAFLMSDVVQDFMEDAAVASCSHSLVAKRAAAEAKRHEGRNITLGMRP